MNSENYVFAIDQNNKYILGQSQEFYFPIIKLKIVTLSQSAIKYLEQKQNMQQFNEQQQQQNQQESDQEQIKVLAVLSDKITFYLLKPFKYLGTFEANSVYFDGFVDIMQNQDETFTAISGDGFVTRFNQQLQQLSSQQLYVKDLIKLNENQAIASYSKWEDAQLNKLVLTNVQININDPQPYKISKNILQTQFSKLYQLFYVKNHQMIIINEQFKIYALHVDVENNELIFNNNLEKLMDDIIITYFDYDTQTLYLQQNNQLITLIFEQGQEIVAKAICQYQNQLENILVKNNIIVCVKHGRCSNIEDAFDVITIQ